MMPHVSLSLVKAASLALLTGALSLTAAELPVPPRYEIGAIPDQSVWYSARGNSLIFDVLASELGASPTITASYDETRAPDGELVFDTDLDRLSFTPASTDVEPIQITFLAVGAGAPIVQQVVIEPVQPLPPEYETFGVQPDPSTLPDPESRDYLEIDDRPTGNDIPFNDAAKIATRHVTIVGKFVVFEDGHANQLHELYSNPEGAPGYNVESLEIHADTLIFSHPRLRLSCSYGASSPKTAPAGRHLR